jgi:hypothetical protein
MPSSEFSDKGHTPDGARHCINDSGTMQASLPCAKQVLADAGRDRPLPSALVMPQ